MALSILAMRGIAPEQQLTFLESVASFVAPDQQQAAQLLGALQRYRKLRRKRFLNPKQRLWMRTLEQAIKWGDLQVVIEDVS